MSKISRADSKARFRTGMYPTQADFENLHDSYVHKDDTIPLEQVGTNGATVVSLLNQKANSSHTHEIADVNGLQAFITKVNTFLDTVDASDDTINRWKEIEAFLTGITDTQTLTGLLANLRTEIVALIPAADNKAYLQLVADLDAYTDAPVGTIVKYTGQTNNKYTHGFNYEKVGGEPQGTIDLHTPYKHALVADSDFCSAIGMADLQMKKHYPTGNSVNFTRFITTDNNISLYAPPATDTTSVGAVLFSTNFDSNGVAATYTISRVDGDFTYISVNGQDKAIRVNPDGSNSIFYSFAEYIAQDGGKLYINDSSSTKKDVFVKPADGSFVFGNTYARCENATEDIAFSIAGPASWQPSKSMSVID